MGVCNTALLSSGTIINIFAGPSSSRCTALYVRQSSGSPKKVKSAYLFDSSNVKHELYISGDQTAYLGSIFNNGYITDWPTGENRNRYRPTIRDGVTYTLEEIWGNTIFSYISSPTNTQQYSVTTTSVTSLFTADLGTLELKYVTIYAFDNDNNRIGTLSCNLPAQKCDLANWYVTVDNDIFNICDSRWSCGIYIKHRKTVTGQSPDEWTNWTYNPTSSNPDIPQQGGTQYFHEYYSGWFIQSIKVELSANIDDYHNYGFGRYLKCQFVDPTLGSGQIFTSPKPYRYSSNWGSSSVTYTIDFSGYSSNEGYDKFTTCDQNHPILIKLWFDQLHSYGDYGEALGD
jgi:hypothetical protein